ncbi:hypothetical protein HCG51_05830 [Tolypothrix sp. PCC 7910]|nr:hypothetical protein HCG51_05830 [Tolypothrix sp. PCC 7910]
MMDCSLHKQSIHVAVQNLKDYDRVQDYASIVNVYLDTIRQLTDEP